MGSGHSHRAGHDEPGFEVASAPRRILLVALGLAALATVAGLISLWPSGAKVEAITDSVNFAAAGVTFPGAEVTRVEEACPPATGQGVDGADPGATSSGPDCGQVRAKVDEGAGTGETVRVTVAPEVLVSGLTDGDRVRLQRTPGSGGDAATYSYFGTDRSSALWILLLIFVVAVVAVARWRGLFALFGLAFSAVVIWKFMLPALLTGGSGLLVGLTGAAAIMFVVLYTTHGFSVRTSAALAGTLVGVGLTAVIGLLAVGSTRLTGVTDESGSLLTAYAGDLSFQGLLSCAVIVAGLGVLNDVTITQASAVWELRGAAPTMSRRAVFSSGMRIGRDHIASTIYTIVFAYAGTALLVLLILQLYGLPIADLLATEQIAQEVVRTLATSIGLVLAVPLTTAIAAVLVPAGQPDSAGRPDA